MVVPKLTLDTNVLRELWDERPHKEAVEQLLDLAARGEIDLAVSRHVREDIPREPLASRLAELPVLKVKETGGVFRLDLSTFDGPDVLGTDHADELDRFHSEAVQLAAKRISKRSCAKPPDERDWNHLLAHDSNLRDVFLTWDGGILAVAPELLQRFRLTVLTPDEYLQQRAARVE
ncbi:MAG: hypothetical protein KGJ86_03195 [Chloroflexota bacterium]|nr:hypothetical protein [Chloroflexota bacterium]